MPGYTILFVLYGIMAAALIITGVVLLTDLYKEDKHDRDDRVNLRDLFAAGGEGGGSEKMPNWCKGNMRLRGNPQKIVEFLRNEIKCVANVPGTVEIAEAEPVINEEYSGMYVIKMPEAFDHMPFGSFHIKGTKRNFLSADAPLRVEVDMDEDVWVAYLRDFRAAWDIYVEPYVEKAKKYGLDIKIYGCEAGMQFEREIEILANGTVRNEKITYNDWLWDSPFPFLGG